uniref:Uncharacterized protein n=1 Tax=Meloidogyne javanica TaxID=6303 RepID=A0A915MER1_MELJA
MLDKVCWISVARGDSALPGEFGNVSLLNELDLLNADLNFGSVLTFFGSVLSKDFDLLNDDLTPRGLVTNFDNVFRKELLASLAKIN